MRQSYSDATLLASLLGVLARFLSLLGVGGYSHAIHILGVFIKLKQLTAFLLAAGTSLLVWPPSRVFLCAIFQEFTLLQVVSGAMHQECFTSSQMIVLIACIYFPALASAALLSIVWRDKSSSLLIPDVSITVGI